MNEEPFTEVPTDGFALHIKAIGVMRQVRTGRNQETSCDYLN